MDDLISRKDVITAVETSGGNYLMALETISSMPAAAEMLRLTARIAQLESVVAAGDRLADVVMGGSTRNVMERYATNFRAAKDAANG